MSFTDSTYSTSEKPVSVLWGCELSKAKDSCTFQVTDDWHCDQQLVVRTICLGETARDEFHVVEVVAEDGDSRSPVPLATLKPSVLPTATLGGVELTPPVTFRLRCGSGPVYVSGQHVSMINLSSDEESDEEEEEETPKKPPKGPSGRKGGAAKKRKVEKADELNKASSEDPLPGKGRGAGRGKKGAAKK